MYSQTAQNSFVCTSDNPPCHELRFEGALKLMNVYDGSTCEGFQQKHYVVAVKLPPTIRALYVGASRSRENIAIELTAPCLEDFGHNLEAGQTYIIKGSIADDIYNGVSWQINPLLARLRYPVICDYPVNRMIIHGTGLVKDVIELCDEDKGIVVQHEVVVNISYNNSPLGMNVRVVMHPSIAPITLIGGFAPGVHIIFRGYLTNFQTDEGIMRVEILTHDQVRHA